MKGILRKISHWLGDLFFPKRCLLCGEKCKPGLVFCGRCKIHSETYVRLFYLRMGRNDRESRMFKVFSPHAYEGSYREALHRYKFRGKTVYAESFASMIEPLLPKDTSVITYVPMSEKRRKKRGYNQAELIAKAISDRSGIPCRQLLEKVKDNIPQHTLKAKDRKRNVKGVFASKGDILGQKVVLIDDIITTGSTICECASCLYLAGAELVTGICAADAQTRQNGESDTTIERICL